MPRGTRQYPRAVKPSEAQMNQLDDAITAKVVAMRVKGHTYAEAAEALNMSESEISNAYHASMTRTAMEMARHERGELLLLELLRLDELQKAVWTQAAEGDRGSVETILKVMDSRSKLLRFAEGADQSHTRTVVASGDSDSYIKALEGTDA